MLTNGFKKAAGLGKAIALNGACLMQRLRRVKSLDVRGKEVILFYLPAGNFITGGVLSIFFLLDKSIELRPDAVVLPVVVTKLQRYFRTTWFKSPFFIYNLLDIHKKLHAASRIVIHVPECLCEDFFAQVRKHKLQPLTQKAVVNILNQNVECMPPDEVFYRNKPVCGKLTMTLAFAVNRSINYPFLDLPSMTMSAWSYGDRERYTEFETKENICIVSPDEHPLKEEIVGKLAACGLECIEIRNMPFEEYRDLCCRAKWAVTFGEGYDGYAMGTLKDGGIGFAVDRPEFRPSYMDADHLPPNVFDSYENMCDNIVERINYFENHPAERKQVSAFFVENARKLNSPELVARNLDQYYTTIGF